MPEQQNDTTSTEVLPTLTVVEDAVQSTPRARPSDGFGDLGLSGSAHDYETPKTPWVPLGERPKRAPRPGLTAASPLLEAVEDWHSAFESEAIAQADTDLRAAVEAANDAAGRLKLADREQRDEPGQRAAAISAGREAAPATDWTVERALRGKAWNETYAAAQAAQREYVRIVQEEAHRLIGKVRESAAVERAKAEKALEKARGQVARAVLASEAINRYAKKVGALKRDGLWRTKDARAVDAVLPSLDQAIDLLKTIDRDPVLNGDLLDDPKPAQVPEVTREALWHSRRQSDLGKLEAIETYEERTEGVKRLTYRSPAQSRYAPQDVAARLREGLLP